MMTVRAVIRLPGGNTFTVRAQKLSEKNIYVQSVELNGVAYDKAYLRHADIVKGGTLTFVMGPEPNRAWASAPESAPYSMSRAAVPGP